MSLDTAKSLLAEALLIETGAIDDGARIGSIEQWDSLAHMRLLTAIEEKLGKPLDAETAAAIESLADVARVLG
ncbi:MAG: acyl carrier protein [Micropepsaceae bacterium]